MAPANQTKERSVHELFAGAFQNKSSLCESCLFSYGKTREFPKMGEIHELFVLALSLVWFAGATSDSLKSARLLQQDKGFACARSVSGIFRIVACTAVESRSPPQLGGGIVLKGAFFTERISRATETSTLSRSRISKKCSESLFFNTLGSRWHLQISKISRIWGFPTLRASRG